MPGAIARNPHEGSRSEILADYFLSAWGTVTPVRRQDDHGVDLYCTITDPVGRRAVVSEYYSVQVKSTDDPWVFNSVEEVRWLLDYPTPLFLALVDKAKGQLSVYHTLSRFLAGFWGFPPRLELAPTNLDEGQSVQWKDGTEFSLSAPILRVSLSNFLDQSTVAALLEVFRFWVRVDRENCNLRRMGILRFRMPPSYRVNTLPSSGTSEQGNLKPTDEHLDQAVATLCEVVDCVGHQLAATGDRESALYSLLLLHHLREKGRRASDRAPYSRMDLPSPFECETCARLNEIQGSSTDAPYLFAGIEEVMRALSRHPIVAKYCENNPVSTDASG